LKAWKINAVPFDFFSARFAAFSPIELKTGSPGAAAREPAAQGNVSFRAFDGTTALRSTRAKTLKSCPDTCLVDEACEEISESAIRR
jgi:hypothetical protein